MRSERALLLRPEAVSSECWKSSAMGRRIWLQLGFAISQPYGYSWRLTDAIHPDSVPSERSPATRAGLEPGSAA